MASVASVASAAYKASEASEASVASRGRWATGSTHVPRHGLRPCLLLYFAEPVAQRPRQRPAVALNGGQWTVGSGTLSLVPDRESGAPYGAK